ncbi:MAG: GNAT family N-acetyltransferase [Burkholderiaceae bacterium]|nr:GNAT family N-acetyltransferase [Burkholderiaceae bacterium]MCD8516533.1 GNAT family N-acetyltransferase [Burkholderiaceae bacterium]MCD8564831.1 GNAT family N-acetyltransferase [Burkholderiaceae bacterium]
MKSSKFFITALESSVDRSDFDCGVEPLNRYFTTQVGQDIKRRITSCFIATHSDGDIAGFYTLAAASIALKDLPSNLTKKLPRYPSVPAVRLGRLAVSVSYRGRGLGAALLADALTRSLQADIAAYAMLVNAKDETAAKFYEHHGFMATKEDPDILYLPLATAKQILSKQ